jgi:hypothetical protein
MDHGKLFLEQDMATIEELKVQVALLEELAKDDVKGDIKSAFDRASELLKEYKRAIESNPPDIIGADQAAANINGIRDSVIQLVSRREGKTEKWWSYVGMAVLAIVFLGLAVFIYSYGTSVGLDRLVTIEGTRPLLVIAAIASTIAFGGALLLGSLFSSEGKFEDRFRHAREIFLVFSGIFGTVIGFYFGADDEKQQQLGVSGTLEGTTIAGFVTGGSPPYKLTITYGPNRCTKTEESQQGLVQFSFADKTKVNLVGMKISAIDSRGIQGDFSFSKNQDELVREGWSNASDLPCN